MKKNILKMILSLTVITVWSLAGAGFSQAYTWKYNPATEHWYTLTRSESTWTAAEAEAVSLGGHLVTIRNNDEEAWLMQPENFGDQDVYWIGFYQPPGSPEPAGGWSWISGEPVTYTHWDGPEPNNFLGNEHYGVMNFWDDVNRPHWNDERDAGYKGPHRGIIERTTAPPGYGTVPFLLLLLLD